MRVSLDSDVCIALLKGIAMVRDRLHSLQRGDAVMSSVAYFELCYGVAKSARPRDNLSSLRELVADLPVIEMNETDAQEAGEIRAILEMRGQTIGPYDTLIAGQAKARGLIMVTHNTRQFSRVPGLRVEDWLAAG